MATATSLPPQGELRRHGIELCTLPDLCSGERTAAEVSELTHRWTIPALANSAQIAWFQPGIRDDLLQPRVDTEVPEVLYPSIHLDARSIPSSSCRS